MEFKPAISLDEFKSSFGQSTADASGKTTPAAASPVKSVKNPFDDAAAFTMGEEGGYVKNDAGKGETNLGVNKTANPDIDVKALTPEKAKWEVYKPRYWDAIGGDEIAAQNPTLAKVAFDTAFNMGVEPAKQMLKQSGGDPLRMLALRAERYRSLLAANPDKFGQYANGWRQRLNKLHALVQEGGGYASPANAPVASGPSDFTGERSTAGGANWNPVERTLGDSVVGGFKKGFDQSLGLGASALALANRSITGEDNNDFQKSMLSYAKQKEEDAAGHSGNAPSFTDAAFGDASLKHWLGDSIGYLTYQALESLATGGAGALLGRAVGKGAVETVAKGMIEKEVGRIVSTEAGKSLAKEEIGKLAARNVAQKLTAGTALFANNLRQEAGGVYSDALDNQSKTGTPVDLTNVWLSSLAATGVDTAADIAALRGLLGKEASSAKTLAGRAATQLPRQMGIQGGTEYTQSLIEQAGAGKNPFTASGQLEAFNEGAVGALGGILPGAASSFHRAEVDPKLKPVLDKAKENNSPLSKAAAEGIKAQPITELQPASQDAAQRLAELEQKLQSSSLSGEEVQEYKTLRQLKDDNDAIRNELSGAGAEKQDDILYRASQIEQAVNTNSGISALRQPDSPVDAKQFLNDLAIAKSKSSNPAAREQALSRLEFAAGWMGIDLTGPAPVAGPGNVWSQEGKAAQNAIGKAAEIAGPQDRISKRVSEIEDEIRSTNAISALRSIGQSGVTEKEFLEALAIAKNPSIDKTYPGLRQRALESLETGMRWVRQGSMPGVGSKVNFTFGNNNPTGTSLTVPGAREVGPVGSGQFFDPNVIDGEATRVDEGRLPGPRATTGPQSGTAEAAPKSRSASSQVGGAPALGFTGTASPAEQQNVALATAAQGETPAQQAPALSVSEATSDMPRVAIPQDGGSGVTAARRKRKAQLGQLVQAGFGTVEKRGDGFVLHNAKTGQSVQLDGAADVQMARQAVTQAQRSQADTSPNSPANDKTPASEAQIAAGNYSKPSSVVNGITVRYENPKGSTRSGVDSNGVAWSTTMKHDYGHDDRVVGADGDKLDIFVGDHPASSKIFVIDQQNQDGSFDEHKVIMGARSEDEARKTYLANYESGWTGLGDITELTREQYDAWTAGGQVSEPISLGKNDVVTLSDAGQPVKVQLISTDEIGSGKKPDNGYYALTKQDAEIISAIGAALGVRTAFFRGVTPGFSPDGIYTQGNTVLMGESYSRGPLSVFLHEFTHLLEGSNPKAYGSLMAVIRSRVADPKGYRADYYGKQYAEQKGDTALSDDELRELIGDLGGDMMNDAAFWGDVFADIQAKHGKEAQGIIAKLAEFLNSLIQKAVASIPQKAFGASKFVNEASEIREAFRAAVTLYMEENGFQYNGAASDIAKAAQMMAEQQTDAAVEAFDRAPGSTALQRRKSFGQATSAVVGAGGNYLRGRRNNAAAKAMSNGDAQGVLNALLDSKSQIVRFVAEKAKKLSGLKVGINQDLIESHDVASFTSSNELAKTILSEVEAFRLASEMIAARGWRDASRDVSRIRIDVFADGVHEATTIGNKMLSEGGFNEASLQDMASEAEDLIRYHGEDNVRRAASAVVTTTPIRGAYDSKARTVYASTEYSAGDEHVLAHELAHALTENAIQNPTSEQKPIVEKMRRLHEHVKASLGDEARDYGLSTLKEFSAEALSNPDFQVKLSEIPYENTTAWGRMTQLVADLFGWRNGNALTELLALNESLIDSDGVQQPTVTPEPKSPQLQATSEDVLQDVGLLREHAGRWKYRTRPEGTWFTANSKSDAVDRATAGYLSMPESDRLTRAQRDAKADAEYDAESERRYGRLSIEQLEKLLDTTAGDIAANQKAGQSEFNGNGGRRTGAAVSSEAARVLGEEKMRLERYIASRKAADASKPTQESSAPTASDDGIKILAGKGLIKGKFNAEVDGDGVPGGPFDTEQAARAAALQWRAKTKQRADDAAAEKQRRSSIAQKFRDGKPVTAIEIKSLGLPGGTSDVRDFFGIAADLFGLKSRDIRPIVKDLIRVSTTDMGAKREYVATRKALETIGKSQSEQGQANSADLDATTLTPKQYHEAKLTQISSEYGTPMPEVREMYDTEGGRAEHQREWLGKVEQAAKNGAKLTRQTLDKFFEIAPNARLPEGSMPDGYQKPEARKSEAEEKQARAQGRKSAKAGAASNDGGSEKQKPPILQNRNRSTPSSIAQMQSIASRPDYGRLGFSRDFANGAPVVAGGSIPADQLGTKDVAVASDGRRIPIQYAVVDASSILASNRADGTQNADYADQSIDRVRAIAGNGRVAGMQAAYSSGTTSQYEDELANDMLHGVSRETIRSLRQPVLVRVMPSDQVTDDIGDVSNTVGNLSLSPVEQANNDAQRVNLDALQFSEDGGITSETVRQFVRSMPQAEQGGLIDTNGQPTRQAVDRLNAAVFAKAYGNDQLVRLYAQASDQEARNILSALSQVAPKMARLDGAGSLDVREIVTQAAEIAINARRRGDTLDRAAAQIDMAADPDVGVVLQLFADNTRTVRPVVEALGRMADMAYSEANKPSEDMFGVVEKAGRQDIINQLKPENERASKTNLEVAAGGKPAQVNADRGEAQAGAQGDAATPEGGRASQAQGLTKSGLTAEDARGTQKRKARQPVTPDQAGNMRDGDVVVDGNGKEFVALGARHKWLEVAPIVDGKPQVSADTTIKFHLEPETKHLYKERRGDPIYATGRNAYSEPQAQQPEPLLTAPTPEEIVARQDAAEAAQLAAEAAERKFNEDERKRQERDEVRARSNAAADTFELGMDPMENLTGQQDIFSMPAPAPQNAATSQSKNTVFTEDAASQARERLKRKLSGQAKFSRARDQGNTAPQQGIDAEMMMDGITLSGYHIESGARTFADYARAMLADLGEGVRPYLKSWYMGVKYDPRASGFTGMDSASTVDAADVNALTAQESKNAPSTDEGVERDSQDATPGRALVNPVSSGPRGASEADGATGGQTVGEKGGGQPRDPGLPAGGAAADGNRGDFLIPGGNATTDAASVDAGTEFRERGGDIGVDGVSTDPVPAAQVEEAAHRGADRLKKEQIQKAAEKIKVIPQDIENIRATLPYLLEGQQDDVLKAETQFAKPDGYGMLFTNGTGTGKTFTGLGVVKRLQRQGKTNILIVVPDDKIAADWIESGEPLGLTISKLKDTQDAGSGIVITSYANLGDNDALARRQWDMVVADEAHTLMQSADGTVTKYLASLRAITHHPDGATKRTEMLYGDIRVAAVNAQNKADLAAKSDDMRDWPNAAKYQAEADKLFAEFRQKEKEVRAEVAAMQGAQRTRLLALSATPFAYEFTVDWANGYLFDYSEGQASDRSEFRGYNQGSNRDRFFMTHFGYSMRYNKLTKPDPSKVDTGLLQRNFNGWLRKKGALSARMLDVAADYDRRFILIDSAIGNQIDDALNWISEKSREGEGNNGYSMLRQEIDDKFDHLSRRYLLEAIKADAAVPIVREHMKLGRKVIVFHDYKKGGGFNPFDIPAPGKPAEDATPEQIQAFEDYKAAVMEFRAKFKGLVNAPLGQLDSPIEVFSRELPDVLIINGDEKKKDLLERYKRFQDDASGPQVMLVQSAKNKGWSGHDTTGKHQRVLMNLGQPTAPTLAIQQEGRAYRTGQVTDVPMRYFNTGTSWEKWAFASTIAGRASTAENLGMGEQARALKDSFIAAFEESDAYPPGHEGEGKGGKERDKLANSAITAYDRAKTYYWATQKKNSKTKAQEGADYYATPEPVGFKMAEWLGLRGGESSLEPSAGHGAIARWLPEITNRTVIEPSNVLRARLAMAMDVGKDRIIDDTFENHAIVNKYDGIAMNPPFGVGGKTAIEHVAKAANHLRDGGRIVALIPTGPAADKRFDQWMYGESERQAKPLYIDPNHGPVYKGDTLTLTGFGTLRKIVVDKVDGRVDGPRYVRDANTPPNGAINITAISKVEPTGKRTESYRASEGLYTVAEIKLPQVTFERAGTAVATRIVVLEKQTDSKRAPSARSTIDLSGITDIKELFDRIEDLTLPARAMTPEQQAADKAAQEEGQRQAKKVEAKSKPKAANPDAVGTVDSNGEPIIEHVTAKGKTLRGIVRTDLLKEEALKIDPYTFRKNGGWFIREVYLKPEGDAKLSRARSDQNDATLADYNRRIESMEELLSCIGK